jgi:hypothetical protein
VCQRGEDACQANSTTKLKKTGDRTRMGGGVLSQGVHINLFKSINTDLKCQKIGNNFCVYTDILGSHTIQEKEHPLSF